MNEEEEEDIMIEQIRSRIPELKVKLAEFFDETKEVRVFKKDIEKHDR